MSNTISITLIQANLAWEDKTTNLKNLQEKIEKIEAKTNIVVLPEMFSTGFSMNVEALAETMEGPTIQWMKKLAITKRIILTGSLIIKETSADGHTDFYNRLIWMLPNGQFGMYNKRHLFSLAGENIPYSSGQKRLIASVNDWKVNLQICYDLRFPVWARQTPKMAGENWHGLYDLLIYVANWPEKRGNAWRTLLQARAIENQCYVVGVNRVGIDGNGIYHCGDSMVIDPMGEVLYHKKDIEDVFTINLDKEKLIEVRAQIPFWKDADPFTII